MDYPNYIAYPNTLHVLGGLCGWGWLCIDTLLSQYIALDGDGEGVAVATVADSRGGEGVAVATVTDSIAYPNTLLMYYIGKFFPLFFHIYRLWTLRLWTFLSQ